MWNPPGIQSSHADPVELDPTALLLCGAAPQRQHSLFWGELVICFPQTNGQRHASCKKLIWSSFYPSIQFFNNAKESTDYLKSLQGDIQRKYGCDRTSSVHKLEDHIQESMVSWQITTGWYTSISQIPKTMWLNQWNQGSRVAQPSKALHLSARGVTTVPGLNPGCITSGRDWDSHRTAHNWPSIVRVWSGRPSL